MSRRAAWGALCLLLSSSVGAAEAPPPPSSWPTQAQMESRALLHVRREFERIGRNAPQLDPVLTTAAVAVAREALETSAEAAADLLALAQVVSDADGFDPTPRAIVVRDAQPDLALAAFLRRGDYNEYPATHLGIGVYRSGARSVVVAMLAERKARLDTFPRQLSRPHAGRRLCGALEAPLGQPELYITRPAGSVDRLAASAAPGGRFCATLPFRQQGRHTVEVIGRGARGPEVAAIFFVDVGQNARPRRPPPLVEPDSPEAARAILLARINGLRASHGSRPLALDPLLSQIAQQHSDKMAREHFFAHVSPSGDDLRQRLTRAGYAYRRAGENLGLATGPLGAHLAIEHSPGHRLNLLDPDFTRLGLGIAYEEVGGQTQAILTEVLVDPTQPAPDDPLAAAYRALTVQREGKGLPPLVRSPVLEAIAIEHARRALKLGEPRIGLPGTPLHERVFRSMKEVKSAAVDFYVSDDPSTLPDSRSLVDSNNDRVGIGAVRGDSPTYGADKFWVVVIYADSR